MATPATVVTEDGIVLTRTVVNTKLLELKSFYIPKKRIGIQSRRLGAGGFGEVKLATLAPDSRLSNGAPTTVAVKVLEADGNSIIPLRLAYRLAREMIVWASCQHENILGFIGYFLPEDFALAYLVSPYMRNGNVRVYLEKNRVNTEDRLGLLRDTTNGLQYLHTRKPPIVHGDLKSLNVLVNDHRRAVLCDFGLSAVMQDTSTGLTTGPGFQGSTRWSSPEVITGSPKTLKSDMWGWGCLALEIMMSRIPYHEIKLDNQVIIQLCGSGTNRKTPEPSNPPHLPEGLLHLLRGCWEFSPDLRPGVDSCVDWLRPRTSVQRALPLKSSPWIDKAIMEQVSIFEEVVHNWVALAWKDWTVARILFQVSILTPKELLNELELTQGKLRDRSMDQDPNLLKGYFQLREQVLTQELNHRSKKPSFAERRQSPSCKDPTAQLLQTFSMLRNPIALSRSQVEQKLKGLPTYLKPFLGLLDQDRRLSFPLLRFERLVQNFPDDRDRKSVV